MKFKKIISNILTIGLLLNNAISSFAGVLSEDGRYETFEGNNITINDILEEDKVDVEIEGNTLVNLLDTSNLPFIINCYSSNEELIPFNNISSKQILDSNKEYTLYLKYKIDIYGNYEKKGYGNFTPYPKLTYYDGKIEYIDNITSRFASGVYSEIIKFTPSKNVELFQLDFKIKKASIKGSFLEAVLIEGDYSEIDIKYFSGVKSVNESNDDKTSLISNSKILNINNEKNLICHLKPGISEIIDNKLVDITGNNNDALLLNVMKNDLYEDYIEFNGINSYATLPKIIKDDFTIEITFEVEKISNGNYNLGSHWYNNPGIIDAETPNVTNDFGITINPYGNLLFGIGNPDETYTNKENSFNSKKTIIFSRNKNTGYVNIYIDGNLIKTIFSENKSSLDAYSSLKIGKSSQLDNYCKMKLYELKIYEDCLNIKDIYVSDIKSIDLKEPLRKLSDNIADKIINKNGQWLIERNCGQITLTGNEKWILHHVEKENTALFYTKFDAEHTGNNSASNTMNVISNNFKYLDTHWETTINDVEGIYTSFNGNLCISINKSRLNSLNTDCFNEWLKNNPTVAVYKLSSPVYEYINPIQLRIYPASTDVYINSYIPTNLKITVDRAINRTIEAIELAKINPTIDNISKARMWTNLVKESLKKDELQKEINNITEVKGLELEKKSITANVDIYIKSENSLSMTLSTNSIMFEDYSGVSDIEKLNALEITVNSSLPYDLNAYLENEIQNSDKSTTMDSTLLQIKESSNLDYKTFNNTTDKVILEEDCPSGNYNKHNIDLKMEGSNAYKADVYKTVIKFEAKQK